jgi:TetR/AcrR family transcriptional regulator, tetracycline repressor protein
MRTPGESRRTRATAARRKPRDLTRDKLVDAALKLIDDTGADAVTMRSLADAVGVTPMALYNHFSSKRDLLSAIAESVVGTARFDGAQADWRDRIRHCFEVLRNLCLQHPGLPRLLQFEGAAPASVFAPMEITLRALHEAGLDDVDSVRTYFLLIGFTLAQAAYQTRPVPDLEPSERIRSERIAGRGYTATERLELPATWDFDASFAFGISLILNGVEATVSQRRDGAVDSLPSRKTRARRARPKR